MAADRALCIEVRPVAPDSVVIEDVKAPLIG
jgi:hypothetical protein